MKFKTLEDFELRFGAFGIHEQAKKRKRKQFMARVEKHAEMKAEYDGEIEYDEQIQEGKDWNEYYQSRAVRPDLIRRDR